MASCMCIPAVQAAKTTYEKPDYDEVIATVEKVNDYWITTHKNDVGSAFWERGAYNAGNMEAYFYTGIEEYKAYAEKWAVANQWMGNRNKGDKSKWTWGYTGDVNSTGALFGDWQTCFHTYADLYILDEVKDENKIARAREVMEYQMSKPNDDFWWWDDSLFMVMPAMVKLYNITGNELYLDKLHTYFKYAKELMYDGPGGIPSSIDGYTTSARLKNGAQYSDPENYTHLFYRDANYVYPLNPIPGNETTKNFWARGGGWVFAALSKVLEATPENWEHRDEFLEPYLSMAKALKDCQKFDDEGRGFWTQSVLAHDYSCDPSHNPYGYETSGTAFYTYGFLWGINSGLLDEAEYKDTALAGWKYLTEIAIQPSGRVGYVQWVGGEAGKAAVYDNTQDFAVGAALLAGCEMAKYVGGMQGYFYPYLQRKMVNTVSLKINSPYVFKDSTVSLIDEDNAAVTPFIENERTLVPVRVISEGLGASVEWNDSLKAVTIKQGDTTISMKIGSTEYTVNDEKKTLEAAPVIVNERTFVPIRAISEALGKIVYYNDAEKMIVIGYKTDAFYDSEANMEKMLAEVLTTGKAPEKNPKFKDLMGLPKELKDSKLIKAVSATATKEPENFNPIRSSIDGDPETRWACDEECELTVDFGKVQYMEKIGVSFWQHDVRTTKFDLYISEDGTNYEKIFSGDSVLGAQFNILDCGKNVRYVKLHGYYNSVNNWVNVMELVGYGEGTEVVTNLK